MKLEFFVAKRILFGKVQRQSYTKPVINIAVWGIALGVLIMIMAVAITKGFQKEIKHKIVGFSSDIQIADVGLSESYESRPILFDADFYEKVKADPEILHIQQFASKAGIIKTKKDMQGVILKGITPDFNWSFFKKHIIEGDTISITPEKIGKEALISSKTASTLNLKLGDKFRVFFVSKQVTEGHEHFVQKKYAFTIKGIYETGLSEEFDSKFIFIDMKRIVKLNKWEKNEIGGYEVFLAEKESDNLFDFEANSYDRYLEKESFVTDRYFDHLSFLDVRSIYSRYTQIVSWLEYIDMHIFIILMIILVVAIVNMSSSLLILILEKTNMIGIFKSLGATNWSIRKVFVIKSFFLIGKGVLYGNALALLLGFIQIYFEPIKLQASIYYLDAVPVYFNFWHILSINLLTVVVCSLMMIVPSIFISYISPVKAIKFS